MQELGLVFPFWVIVLLWLAKVILLTLICILLAWLGGPTFPIAFRRAELPCLRFVRFENFVTILTFRPYLSRGAPSASLIARRATVFCLLSWFSNSKDLPTTAATKSSTGLAVPFDRVVGGEKRSTDNTFPRFIAHHAPIVTYLFSTFFCCCFISNLL